MYDFCVIGGGIVGLATAMSLLERRPDASVMVLEKEHALAHHQSGHNSGVIHSGIYYEPGSLKATLCRAGAQATKDFCAAHDIPIRQLGKLLVATNARELGRLEGLVERAARNTVIAHPLNRDELREREPAVTGLGALLVPATASVDYRTICTAMQQVVRSAGGRVELGVAVTAITETAAEVVVGGGPPPPPPAPGWPVGSSSAAVYRPTDSRAWPASTPRSASCPSAASTTSCPHSVETW